MPLSFNEEALKGLRFEVGSMDTLQQLAVAAPLSPFDENVLSLLEKVSRRILADRASRAFPDVITLAFWLRRANLLQLKEQQPVRSGFVSIGRGAAFHIAPSNVPVNYAYSLATGLLAGCANVVKIPSKTFPQVDLINRAFADVLSEMPDMAPYVVLVRYGHEKAINDALSALADARIIWGGDNTIQEIRKSPLHTRAVEVCFADRYSLAVIDSDAYLAAENKAAIAVSFYNDTYLTDQNACTSPRCVIWTGNSVEKAQAEFWSALHTLLLEKYALQPVQAVNKLTSAYLLAAVREDITIPATEDNLIVRVHTEHPDAALMDLKDNSGFFFECTASSAEELRALCADVHCQTVSYYGSRTLPEALPALGIKGIDRVVPMGQTMDFELIWDGYDLLGQLTRSIRIR